MSHQVKNFNKWLESLYKIQDTSDDVYKNVKFIQEHKDLIIFQTELPFCLISFSQPGIVFKGGLLILFDFAKINQ